MTAHDFIAQVFSRPQHGVASNLRYITRGQLDLLERLIGEDEEGGSLQRGTGIGFVWMPSGRNKYVAGEEPRSGRCTLMRLANIVPSASGRLF